MSIITRATPAKPAKTSDAQKVIYAYTFILIVFVLCQLFTYDDFLKLLEGFFTSGSAPIANILGSIIVTFELLALPFLLGMRLSHLMRVVSMVLGWLVPTIWLLLSIWINVTPNNINSICFLGALVDIIPGWWAVAVSLALAILAIWSSWGLWPLGTKSSSTKTK